MSKSKTQNTNRMALTEEQLNLLNYDERYALLSKREKKYFNIMKTKKGVLYITSQPGLAKSSIARNIARIMGYQYLDLRLSMIDETDIGLFPYLNDKGNIKTLSFAIPEWADMSNNKPTIIHFEELNRASLQVRNASLQLLLERAIGFNFKFNENVLMLSSGNEGDTDGTDVEEFDAALNNRLIHVKHTLTPDEWIEEFAQQNIHPTIVGFIKNKPEYLIRKDGADNGEQAKAYATPRTWEFLSEYILCTLGHREEQMKGNYNISDIKACLDEVGSSIIGTSYARFSKYLDESFQLTTKHVLNEFQKVKPQLENVNRDKKSELLMQFREMDLKKLKPNQVTNLVSFLELIDEDERVGFLTSILDEASIKEDALLQEPYKTIMLSFRSLLEQISDLSV